MNSSVRSQAFSFGGKFDDIQDVKVTKAMLDLAKHIMRQTTASFVTKKFEDHYEEALVELINAKRSGKTVNAKARPPKTTTSST